MEDITKLGSLLPRFLIEIISAIVCGGLIGIERELSHKSAGLRTNILICLGAVLYMKVSELVALRAGLTGPGDPGRIAAQVVTGIGFLGAGAIIQRHGDISGLTTAATIWVVAAIGLTIGAGYPLLAMLVTGVVLLTLTGLQSVERGLSRRPRPLLLRLTIREDSPEIRNRLKAILEQFGIKPDSFRVEQSATGVKVTVSASTQPEDIRELTTALWTLPGITEVER